MRKIILSLLSVVAVPAFAYNNSLFQEFDNQISVGYGINQNTSGYGTTTTIMPHSWVFSTSNVLNLEVERLLNNGIWLDANANMSFGSGPVNQNPIVGSNGGTYQSSDYGLNVKGGYAFLITRDLQITPYAALGLNSMAGVIQYVPSSLVVANNFAYMAGFGGRIEYRVNRMIEIYADQLLAYNWDQSGPQAGISPQNTYQSTSSLGVKFNLAQNFQLGVKGYYTNYQPVDNNHVPPNGFMVQQQWATGGLVSLGLTY